MSMPLIRPYYISYFFTCLTAHPSTGQAHAADRLCMLLKPVFGHSDLSRTHKVKCGNGFKFQAVYCRRSRCSIHLSERWLLASVIQWRSYVTLRIPPQKPVGSITESSHILHTSQSRVFYLTIICLLGICILYIFASLLRQDNSSHHLA